MFTFINNFYKLRTTFFVVTLLLYTVFIGAAMQFEYITYEGTALLTMLFFITLLFFNNFFKLFSNDIDKHVKKIEQTFVEKIPKGVMITNKNGTIEYVNHHFEEITEFSKDDAIGQKPSILKSGHHGEKFYKKMWHTILSEGYYFGEIINRKKNGEIYPERVTIAAIYNEKELDSFITIFSDVSEEKEILQRLTAEKEKLRHKANTDYLTNIYNRSKFNNILEYEYKNYQRNKNPFCLAFVDIDHFKSINDSYGHGVGDMVLIEFSKLLSNSIRTSDTIARWGGEEFVILFPQTNLKQATSTTTKLKETIETFSFSTINQLTASIGLVQFNEDSNIESLINKADKALYKAKKSGRNKVIALP